MIKDPTMDKIHKHTTILKVYMTFMDWPVWNYVKFIKAKGNPSSLERLFSIVVFLLPPPMLQTIG